MRSCLNCKFSYRAYVNGKVRCKYHKGHKAVETGACKDWIDEFLDKLVKRGDQDDG